MGLSIGVDDVTLGVLVSIDLSCGIAES
jgi:hypothetical protein